MSEQASRSGPGSTARSSRKQSTTGCSLVTPIPISCRSRLDSAGRLTWKAVVHSGQPPSVSGTGLRPPAGVHHKTDQEPNQKQEKQNLSDSGGGCRSDAKPEDGG